jgi:hypothetical protein
MNLATSTRMTTVSGGPLRQNVLFLYKRMLRLGQTWQATSPSETVVEKNYIRVKQFRRLDFK